jgi:hypothetical protein
MRLSCHKSSGLIVFSSALVAELKNMIIRIKQNLERSVLMFIAIADIAE